MIVRGVKHSSGIYKDKPYDNILVHCDCVNDGSMLGGDPVEILKIKTPLFYEELKRHGCGDPAEIVGLEIRPRYNRYGNPIGFDL